MSGKNITLKTKKSKIVVSTKTEKVFKINEIDVNKILVSKKEPYGTNKTIKYFIGYIMMMMILLDHYV